MGSLVEGSVQVATDEMIALTVNGQELVGYAASALIVLSFAMRSVVRLRAVSLAGSATFVAYGLLIESVPIIATNASIVGIHVWFLTRELGRGRDLGAVVVPADSPFLEDFLRHHATDIAQFQPGYEADRPADFALVLMRDGLPAGVVLGNQDGSTLEISLDYVLPPYRDSRLGQWLYGRGAGVFSDLGVRRLTSSSVGDRHRPYLESVGFSYDERDGLYQKSV